MLCDPVPGASIFHAQPGTGYQLSNSGSTGNFNFNVRICSPASSVTFTIFDPSGVAAPSQTFSLSAGLYDLDTLRICDSVTSQFLSYSLEGITHTFTVPPSTMTHYLSPTNYFTVETDPGAGMPPSAIIFNSTGIGQGSRQRLFSFAPVDGPPLSPIDSIFVNITEYGAVGPFIRGNFSGTFSGTMLPPGQFLNVQATFRVLRNQ
ncbi:MAG: hypothetical protein EOO01_18585 [Chitinophagaceae bacterium]|nr:MAG: hypothetical protein EOO01_18585 [Chitinophagaceae bacterium]